MKKINEKLTKHGIKPRKFKASKASQKPKLPVVHTNKQQPTSPTHTKRPSETKKESINQGKLNPHKEDQKKSKYLVNVEREISGKKESSSKPHAREAKLSEKETGKMEDSPQKFEQRNVDSSQQEKKERSDERKQTINVEENVKNENKDTTLSNADESNKGVYFIYFSHAAFLVKWQLKLALNNSSAENEFFCKMHFSVALSLLFQTSTILKQVVGSLNI